MPNNSRLDALKCPASDDGHGCAYIPTDGHELHSCPCTGDDRHVWKGKGRPRSLATTVLQTNLKQMTLKELLKLAVEMDIKV